MSIQIFSTLTAIKNSSKVITDAEELSSPTRGNRRKEGGERDGGGGDLLIFFLLAHKAEKASNQQTRQESVWNQTREEESLAEQKYKC